MRVRLTKKLAERLDGIDLSGYDVGDQLNVSPRKAQLLVAERWGKLLAERRHHDVSPPGQERRCHMPDEHDDEPAP